MHHPTDRILNTMDFVTPMVEHWLEREIAQWVHPMKDRSDDLSHDEPTLLPWSYISLLWSYIHHNLPAVTALQSAIKDSIGKCHHVRFSTILMPKRTDKQRHNDNGRLQTGANQSHVSRRVGIWRLWVRYNNLGNTRPRSIHPVDAPSG